MSKFKLQHKMSLDCENPIQFIHMIKNTEHPHWKQYSQPTAPAAPDRTTHLYYPYFVDPKHITKNLRKYFFSDFEKHTYNAVRDYFDLALCIIEQDTGIHITQKTAESILQEYFSVKGYMYCWATLYNVPLMLLYFMRPFSCFGTIIKKNTALWEFFDKREDVTLEPIGENYIVKNNGKPLRLKFRAILHDRKIIDDEVIETIHFQVFDEKNGKTMIYYDQILRIDEVRFPSLATNAKHRNNELLHLAREMMPEEPPESVWES